MTTKQFKIYPLANDYVFKKVLETHEDYTKTVIRISCEEYIDIDSLDTEHGIETNIDSKKIRFDIQVISDKKIFDLEMQNKNYHDLPLRTRYSISATDVLVSQKGKGFTYNDLPKVVIIFICMFDPWGRNKMRYIADERVHTADPGEEQEDITKEVGYDANYVKIYLNAAYNGNVQNELSDFLHYVYDIKEMKPTNSFTEDLQQSVLEVNERDRSEIMTFEMKLKYERNEYYAKGKEEGIEQGALENSRKNALNMLQDNMSLELVSKYTGLSLEEIKNLKG